MSLIHARRRIFGRMEYQLADGLAVLERTPGVLRAMLAGLPSQWTDATEGPETWSPYVIVGHMIHGERADWVVRARIVVEQAENRKFEPFDRFAQFRESEGKTLVQLLDEFEEMRMQNLRTVRAWELTDAQLALVGEHPAFGAVTLRQLFATWTAHDLGHIGQIARVMAKQYAQAVGPWREYLGVMRR
ncbi:MAG: DinB family protein [Gemmatimonadaceae bacterium]